MNLLSFLIVIPLVGALVLLLVPRQNAGAIKWVALVTVLVNFVVSVFLFVSFRTGTADMQFVERAEWIPQLGISWYVGVDGLSLLLIVLTTFLMIIAIGGSWTSITDRVLEYNLLFLVLVITALRYVIGSIARSFSRFIASAGSNPSNPAQAPRPRDAEELKRDPVCGTFVPVTSSITKTVGGEVVHFCSAACRDRALAAAAPAP